MEQPTQRELKVAHDSRLRQLHEELERQPNFSVFRKLDRLKEECGKVRTDLDKTGNRLASMEMIIKELTAEMLK